MFFFVNCCDGASCENRDVRGVESGRTSPRPRRGATPPATTVSSSSLFVRHRHAAAGPTLILAAICVFLFLHPFTHSSKFLVCPFVFYLPANKNCSFVATCQIFQTLLLTLSVCRRGFYTSLISVLMYRGC